MHSYIFRNRIKLAKIYCRGVPLNNTMIKKVEKPWGKEEWLVLNDKYCLKRMYVNAGFRLSLQYHQQKTETMILEKGSCTLQKNLMPILMVLDSPYTISPGDIHRIEAIEDSVILEVSTPEVDDVIRIEDDYDRIK